MSLTWQDDSAMASKHPTPRTVFNGKLVGGNKDQVTSSGVTIFDGESYKYGAAGTSGDSIDKMWGVDGAGLFATFTVDDTPGPANLLLRKSTDGIEDFVTVLEPAEDDRQTLARTLIDCGHHTFDYDGDLLGNVSRRVILFTEYVNNVTPTDAGKIWFSVQPDATAGDTGTWDDLFFGTVITGIRHFHGGKYIPGKGLYIFTGDADIQASVLFCKESDIPDLFNSAAASNTKYYDLWMLGTGDRSGWGSSVYQDDNILIGNTQDARVVDLNTVDSRAGYWIPDLNPAIGLNSIIKVDFFDVSNSAAGEVSYVTQQTLENQGWYGCASKSGLIYITNASVWGDGEWGLNSNGYSEIICLDPEDDSYEIVKRQKPKVLSSSAGLNQFFGFNLGPFEYGGTFLGMYQDGYFDLFFGDKARVPRVASGYCQKQRKPAAILNSNGSFQSGDFTGFTLDIGMNKISYDNGVSEISIGNTVTGSISGATAEIDSLTTTGAWDGSAFGELTLVEDTIVGVFDPDDTLTVSSVNSADVVGIITAEVIADPTGGVGGNVCRLVMKNLGFVTQPTKMRLKVDVSATVRGILNLQMSTLSLKAYIDPTSDNDQNTDPAMTYFANIGSATNNRLGPYDLVLGAWTTISVSTVPAESSNYICYFQPDNTNADGTYAVYYVTDFQLIQGAIPNSEIEQLSLTGGGGNRYSGGGRYGG